MQFFAKENSNRGNAELLVIRKYLGLRKYIFCFIALLAGYSIAMLIVMIRFANSWGYNALKISASYWSSSIKVGQSVPYPISVILLMSNSIGTMAGFTLAGIIWQILTWRNQRAIRNILEQHKGK
jgi:hypothetical protein